MKKRFVAGLALAGSLAVAVPVFAHAWGGGERCADGPAAEAMRGHGYHGKHGGRGEHGMGGDRMGGPGRAMMRELDLSDAQRDKLAELRNARSETMRAQAQAMREARRELRALGFSAEYDEAKARELAERAAKASAEMATLRAKAANDFYQLLTPEQRQKFGERMARFEQRREHRHGTPGERGMKQEGGATDGQPAGPRS